MNSALFSRTNGVSQYIDANLDLSASTGLLLVPGGNGLVVNTSASVAATMICLDGVPAGAPNTVGTIGKVPPVRLLAAGAITKFARVVQDAGGGVKADPGPGTARVYVGVALEAATAAGQYIIVDTLEPVLSPAPAT